MAYSKAKLKTSDDRASPCFRSRKILGGLDNYVAYHHFKFFENVQFGISISQHHIQVQSVKMGVTKKFEDLCCAELVNYILEAIKKMY
jgi:hypothetical protein